MHPGLEEAVRALEEQPEGDFGAALFLYLEMKNRLAHHPANDEVYRTLIPARLRSVPLSDDDQLELALRLAGLAETSESSEVRHLALTCLSNVESWAGLEPVLRLLLGRWEVYSAVELRVLTLALERLLDVLSARNRSPRRKWVMPAALAVHGSDIGPALSGIARRVEAIERTAPRDTMESRAAEQTRERIPSLERRVEQAQVLVEQASG